jgi:DNA (cytosine-5)-methyltransferase 1
VTGANRGELAVVSPIITPVRSHGGGGNEAAPADNPLRTVTCTKRGEFAVVAPAVARIGQTGGNGGYANNPTDPLTTVTSKAEHIIVAPVLANLAHGDGLDGRDRGLRANLPDHPLGTIHAGGGSFAVIAPTLVQTGYGERDGQSPRALDIEEPLGTVVGAGKHALCSAFLAKHYGGVVGHTPDRPLGTVTAVDHHSLVAANMVHLNHGEKTESGVDEPARTVTAGGMHAALVYSFLTKYYQTGIGQDVREPLHTVTTDDRFGLVTVMVDGQPFAIVDIGMRMLRPRELARAQGFPDSYTMTGSATSQVERIGNSVPPYLAKAVAAANFTPRRVRKAVA